MLEQKQQSLQNIDENSNVTNYLQISRSLPKPLIARKFNTSLITAKPFNGSSNNFSSFDNEDDAVVIEKGKQIPKL